jgi:hypothetical protein
MDFRSYGVAETAAVLAMESVALQLGAKPIQQEPHERLEEVQSRIVVEAEAAALKHCDSEARSQHVLVVIRLWNGMAQSSAAGMVLEATAVDKAAAGKKFAVAEDRCWRVGAGDRLVAEEEVLDTESSWGVRPDKVLLEAEATQTVVVEAQASSTPFLTV